MVGEKNCLKDCVYQRFSSNIAVSGIPAIFTHFKVRYDCYYWCIWSNSDMVDYCVHNVIFKEVIQ